MSRATTAINVVKLSQPVINCPLAAPTAQSWRDPRVSTAAASQLASLPSHVNIVCVAFMLPDATYRGGLTFAGTGLSFRCARDGGVDTVYLQLHVAGRDKCGGLTFAGTGLSFR